MKLDRTTLKRFLLFKTMSTAAMETSRVLPSFITIASFDIGVTNFAYYVERCPLRVLEESAMQYEMLSPWIKKSCKRGVDPNLDSIINRVCEDAEGIEMNVTNLKSSDHLTIDSTSPGGLSIDTRKNLFKHLSNHRDLWERCNIVIFEQQFFNTYNFKGAGRFKRAKHGTGANVKAIKIAEAALSWFLIHYPSKEYVIFSSTHKTQILGAPKKLDKPSRKKWSITQAKKLFEARKDPRSILRLQRYASRRQKLDDVSDCVLQCQAYKVKYLVGKYVEVPQLKNLTLPILRKMCKEKGIKGYSKMKKKEIVKVLGG